MGQTNLQKIQESLVTLT